MGLRSARGVGREAGLEPLQQPEPGDRAGVRVERRRDDRSDRRRADRRACSSTTSPPSTSPTARGRIPIPRARSARPTGRSTCTGTSSATSGSARPRGPTRTSSKMPRRAPTRRRRCSTCPDRPPRPVRLPRQVRRAAGAPAGTTAGGPRRLQRFDDTNSAHRAKRMALDGEVAAAEGSEGHRPSRAPSQPAGPAAAPPNAADPAAQAAALRWFTALAAGDTTIFWRWRRSRSRPAARRSARRTISPRCSPTWRAKGSAARSRSSW